MHDTNIRRSEQTKSTIPVTPGVQVRVLISLTYDTIR